MLMKLGILNEFLTQNMMEAFILACKILFDIQSRGLYLGVRARPLVNGSPSGFLRAPRARVGRRCAPPRRFAPLLQI